jgi:Tfp pilus assembly protein PilW
MKLGERGFSLAEILVSILLTSIIAMGVISVVLSVKQSGPIANNTLVGSDAVRGLADQLRRYVTPTQDCSFVNNMNFAAPGCGGCNASNPQNPLCPPGNSGWQFPGDTGPNSGYALSQGYHQANSYLPPQLASAGSRANMCYCVGPAIGPPGAQISSVTITMSWCPPGQPGCVVPSCSQMCP